LPDAASSFDVGSRVWHIMGNRAFTNAALGDSKICAAFDDPLLVK